MTHYPQSKGSTSLSDPPSPADELFGGETNPLFVVISGPSGAGKDSVLNHMKEQDLPFHFVVTATSRAPRHDETHGVDYFFYSRDEFNRMINAGEFIEYALVYKDYKGIPKSQVQEAFATGLDVLVRLDVQGAATIRKLYPDALLIFLTPPTEEELVERLKARRTESAAELELRIATARKEMGEIEQFDYIVFNQNGALEEAVNTIRAIITAEHHRVQQRKVTI